MARVNDKSAPHGRRAESDGRMSLGDQYLKAVNKDKNDNDEN